MFTCCSLDKDTSCELMFLHVDRHYRIAGMFHRVKVLFFCFFNNPHGPFTTNYHKPPTPPMWKKFGLVNPQGTLPKCQISRQHMRGSTLHTMWGTPTSHSHVSEIIRGECMLAPDMPKPRSSPHSPNQLFIIVIDLLMA